MMKTPLSRLALIALSGFGSIGIAPAVVLSGWTFEVNTPADLNNNGTGPSVIAETGLFTTAAYTASGSHGNAVADWSTPVGNASANAYSVNEWTTGAAGTNYFQYATSSTGYTGITISFDQISSSTGVRDFEIFYSTNGTTYTTTGYTYQVFQNSAAATNSVSFGTWNGTTAIAETSYVADLSAITALDNQSTLFFRFVSTSTLTPSGGAAAAAGTSRMDNVMINGVPEPTAAFLGSLGLLALLRRRR